MMESVMVMMISATEIVGQGFARDRVKIQLARVIVANLCDYYTCTFDLKADNDLWMVHKFGF
jgi:hypothetical protein